MVCVLTDHIPARKSRSVKTRTEETELPIVNFALNYFPNVNTCATDSAWPPPTVVLLHERDRPSDGSVILSTNTNTPSPRVRKVLSELKVQVPDAGQTGAPLVEVKFVAEKFSVIPVNKLSLAAPSTVTVFIFYVPDFKRAATSGASPPLARDQFDPMTSDIDIEVKIDIDEPADRGEALLSLWDNLDIFFKKKSGFTD